MQRYHFDLIDTVIVSDASGALLDDDAQARKVGIDLARKARDERPELLGQGYAVRVRTQDGIEVVRIPIDRLPETKDGS